MSQGYVLFAGCSFTAGDGWKQPDPKTPAFYPPCPESEHLWVNLCHKGIPALSDLELINVGWSGASNATIFANAVGKISKFGSRIKKVFVQWTATHRYQWMIGNDEWSTLESWTSTPQREDINLSTGESYPRKYIEDIKLRFKALHHVHWGIVDIVQYSSTIGNLCNQLGIECYHINGICPWDQDFFDYVSDPSEMIEKSTPFTKSKILNIENRTDYEAQRRYANVHYHYRTAGGIQPKQWINLYNSFYSSIIDTNLDQHHPGIKTNQLYFQKVKQHLEQTT